VFLISSYVIREQEGRTSFAHKQGWEVGRGVAQTMYTNVNKCKSDKTIKEDMALNDVLIYIC
jgi:hypothetical protein